MWLDFQTKSIFRPVPMQSKTGKRASVASMENSWNEKSLKGRYRSIELFSWDHGGSGSWEGYWCTLVLKFVLRRDWVVFNVKALWRFLEKFQEKVRPEKYGKSPQMWQKFVISPDPPGKSQNFQRFSGLWKKSGPVRWSSAPETTPEGCAFGTTVT